MTDFAICMALISFCAITGTAVKLISTPIITDGKIPDFDCFICSSFKSNAFFDPLKRLIAVIFVKTAIKVSGKVKIDIVSST